jgi:hypothetical protein
VPAVPFEPQNQEVFEENDLLTQTFDQCEREGEPPIYGIIRLYTEGLDPEQENFSPMHFLYETLVRECEMNGREAATLIDKAFLSLATDAL